MLTDEFIAKDMSSLGREKPQWLMVIRAPWQRMRRATAPIKQTRKTELCANSPAIVIWGQSSTGG